MCTFQLILLNVPSSNTDVLSVSFTESILNNCSSPDIPGLHEDILQPYVPYIYEAFESQTNINSILKS